MKPWRIDIDENGVKVLQKRVSHGPGFAWETVATRKDFEAIAHLTINECVEEAQRSHDEKRID